MSEEPAAAEDAEATEDDQARSDDPEQRIAELEERLQRFTDTFARLQADYDNYRKRARREREEAAGAARAESVGVLVDLLDDLERAAEAMGDQDARREGLGLIIRRVNDELARLGVVELSPEPGAVFDPDLHDAMLTVPNDEHPPGTVVEVLAKGYALGERLVRAARVSVAEASADEPDQ